MSDDPDAAPVVSSVRGDVAVLTFNLPHARNSMTRDLQVGLMDALEELSGDDRVRALVVTGNGSAFSAGGDMELMRLLPDLDPDTAVARLSEIYPSFIELLRFPAPTIAAVNGPAVGGGLGIALLCDVRVAGESASFSAPFGAIGLPPGMGLTFLLPLVLGHARAMEMLLTSDRWDAAESYRAGLVSTVVPDEQLMDVAVGLARRIASNAPGVLRVVADELRGRVLRGVEEALSREVRAQGLAVRTADYREGLAAIAEKRRPSFLGERPDGGTGA